MTNEEKKYTEALAKAAREYQQYIESNNPQADAWDFYGAFIAGAAWIKKHPNTIDMSYLQNGQDFKDDLLMKLDTLEVKEMDSRLSLEDISILRQIMFDYNRQVRNEMFIPNNEDYCKEILKRFKARKGE